MQLYKRASFLLSLGIMFIGILTFSTVGGGTAEAGTKGPSDETASLLESTTPTPTATPIPTVAPTPTPMPNDLIEVTDGEIGQLVTNYLNAKLTCSYDELAPYVTDPDVIDYEGLQTRTEAITAYNNIRVYTKRGMDASTYKVYCCFDYSFASIDTMAPSIEDMIVKYDENSVPRVYYGELDDEEVAYYSELNTDTDVQALIQATYLRLEEAIRADENLLELWLRIEGPGEQAEDEDADSEDSTEN